MIEDQDTRILAHLQKDGRATNQQLADEVGMSTSACWRRVRALEDSGVIRGYAALLAREQAGFAMSAILHVSLERHDAKFVDEFVSRVTTRREVLECFATTGDPKWAESAGRRGRSTMNAQRSPPLEGSPVILISSIPPEYSLRRD